MQPKNPTISLASTYVRGTSLSFGAAPLARKIFPKAGRCTAKGSGSAYELPLMRLVNLTSSCVSTIPLNCVKCSSLVQANVRQYYENALFGTYKGRHLLQRT